ncbi:hypothetical protein E4U61_007393 [Claviceps capensis]|nr:hypothetical protein E4U61_007393 [Claviceps capensis]
MKKSYCARLLDPKGIRNQRKSASSLFRTKFAIVRWKVAQSEAKEIQSGETPVLGRGTGKQDSALVKEGLVLSILRIHLEDLIQTDAGLGLPRTDYSESSSTR